MAHQSQVKGSIQREVVPPVMVPTRCLDLTFGCIAGVTISVSFFFFFSPSSLIQALFSMQKQVWVQKSTSGS